MIAATSTIKRSSHHVCTGCSAPISGGSVVSFGEALFHLHCFSCAKCQQKLDCQSNLLLLTDGRPVCEDCSYVCKRCGHVIGEEAIMTGKESYHAGCFRCIGCNKSIDDLIYTQTSKGIYCTACHKASKQKKTHLVNIADRPLPNTPSPSSSTAVIGNASVAPCLKSRSTTAQDNCGRTISFNTSSSSSSISPSSSSPLSSPTSSTSSSPSTTITSPHTQPTSTSMKLANALGVGSLSTSLSETSTTKQSLGPSPTTSASTLTNASRSKYNNSNSSSNSINTNSSSIRSHQTKPLELALPDIPSLNLSFFDDNSSELSNLTKSLGVNLHNGGNDNKNGSRAGTIGNTKINRASELLKSSLDHFPQPPTTNSNSNIVYDTTTIDSIPDNVADLKEKLKQTSNRLASTESNFTTLKSASQKALDEFSKAKEEFAKEMGIRQQHEYTILQLRRQLVSLQQQPSTSTSTTTTSTSKATQDGPSPVIAEQEIDRLAGVKVELEKSCTQLKQNRDALATEIDKMVQQAQAGLESSVLEQHQLALQEHIRSLMAERDALKTETEQLNKARDEVIHEMVVLNTKNAELSSMNNDLSRRMSEREREAAAIMAGTSFIHHTPSPSPSTELLVNSPVSSSSMPRKSSETSVMMQRMTSRDSNGSKEGSSSSGGPSKMFKMKKPKGNNVFNKLTSYGASFAGNNNNSSSSIIGVSKKDYHNYYGASPPQQHHAFYGAHENQSLYNLNTTSSMNIAGEMTRKGSKQSCDGVNGGTTSPGSHNFIPTSFLRPVKCSACGEKIWGATEYRCQGCGSISHTKCMSHIPALCYATSSSLELVSPTESEGPKQVSMFGTSLASRVAFEERDVPLLVEQCIAAVEARGMDYEGIYRKSGGAAQMRTIQLSFEANEPLNLKDEDEINDICAVTSVLKQYFRELPNPLLPYELYDQFMDAVRMSLGDSKMNKFMELLSQLPKANYDTMKLLMVHLENVRNQSEANLMTTKNLAMVFGPTLLRDKDATRDLLDMSYKNATIEYIINHTQLLFAD
ncbi:unnamed protein product [Absidia cylindrospora]